MSALDLILRVLRHGEPDRVHSKDLDIWLNSLGVGADNLSVSQTAAGELTLSCKIKINSGTDSAHAATKGQVDTAQSTVQGNLDNVQSALQGQIDTLDGRVDGHDTHLGTIDGEITDLQGRASSLEGRATGLEGRMDTAEGDITALEGRATAVEGRATSLEGRVTTAEHDIDMLQVDLGAFSSNQPLEQIITVPIGSPTPYILATEFSFAADNAVLDVTVDVDGRRQPQSQSGDFLDGGSFRKNSTTQIELAEGVEGRTVTIRKPGQATGGVSASGLAIRTQGAPLEQGVVEINFYGPGVFAEKTSTGKVKVTIPGVGGSAFLPTKQCISGHFNTINIGAPVARRFSDGKIVLADSDDPDGRYFFGVAAESIAPSMHGKVYTFGPNMAGALAGLGFSVGDDVYVGEVPGTYINNLNLLTGSNDDVIRVGTADCAEGVADTLAEDLIFKMEVVSRYTP